MPAMIHGPNVASSVGSKLAGCAISVGLVLTGASAASAQDAGKPGIGFELGVGGVVAPSYEGSSRYSAGAFPIIRFNYLNLKNGFSIGGGPDTGLSFRPSMRFLSARNAVKDPQLTGLNSVRSSFELGAGLSYTTRNFSVFGDLRYGVIGHQGFVGELGADLIARPIQDLTLKAGPRLTFADSTYMNTYFGVSAAEAAGSAFTSFAPSGGVKSVGIELGARYQINENWAGESSVAISRLIGSAGNSPVTGVGSKNQATFKLGLIRSFNIDF